MTTSAARVLSRRRAWVGPVLWLGVPALCAIGPWVMKQRAALQADYHSREVLSFQLTGDSRRDRRLTLECAWHAARPGPFHRELPPAAVERFARRQAGSLADIAELLLPLDPSKAAQIALEAIQSWGRVPERMAPEDLATPLDTPTGQLLQLASRFRTLPAVARSARRAALERARGAEWPGGRVYALCLIARESARSAPDLARVALHEARVRTDQLPADERLGARAALAGSLAVALSRESARPVVTQTLWEVENARPEPVPLALIASLIAPAAPDLARHLAEQAVEHARRATVPPDDMPFRGAFREPLLAALGNPERPGRWPLPVRRRPLRADRAGTTVADMQLRRVAAVLATTDPTAAQRAALLIRHAGDRAGSLVEVAASVADRDPARAEALYRLALRAADSLTRPAVARRAARVRAATGLAAYDARAALAVVEPLPPRLIAPDLNDLAARLARQDPAAALRLIERGEQSVETGDGPPRPLFATARAAVAARIARRDPLRATSLVASLPTGPGADPWITLARALAPPGQR